jgi:uncharacterized protein (DUF433 family)
MGWVLATGILIALKLASVQYIFPSQGNILVCVMIARQILAAKLRNRKFTTAEASAMFGLSQKQINHLVEEIAPLGFASAGQGERLIEYKGLLALLLAQELTDYVKTDRALVLPVLKSAVLSGSAKYLRVPDTTVCIMIPPHRERVGNGLRVLYEAEAEIGTSIEVMQGEPCIKGTRVPAYMIAAIAEERGVNEAISTYSFLTETQVKMAMFYAKAHPRRGRPKTTRLPTKPITSKKVRVIKRPLGRV